jgi:hypothetical protein
MKRFMVLSLAVTALVFAPLLCAQSPTATIREMAGTVELKRQGSNAWAIAKPGDRIDTSTTISTGFKSTAIIAVGSSTIMVQPLTRLSLAELMRQGDTETINVNLRTGRVRVDVNPPAGGRANMSVQSPSATASVRGTSFDMGIDSISVTEGTVSFGSPSRSVAVSAGESTRVDSSGTVLTAMVAEEAECLLPEIMGLYERDGSRLKAPPLLNAVVEIKIR